MDRLPSIVYFNGIEFRVKASEGMVIFEETRPFSGRHSRFWFTRAFGDTGGWYLQFSTSTGELNCSYVVSALKLLDEVYGPNFKEKRPIE